MTSSLGHWPTAPLVYVLAQVQFNRVPLMDQLWESFHQAIFDSFPESLPETFVDIVLKDNSNEAKHETVSRWQFFSPTRRTGIILDSTTLIFHTTDYEDSRRFFQNMQKVLSVLLSVLPESMFLKRVGVRYLDLLLPGDTLTLDQMVIGSLKTTSLDGIDCEYQHQTQNIVHATPQDGTLVIKYRQSERGDVLPNDLFPNKLTAAPLLERITRPEGTAASSLDIDHFKEMNEVMGTATSVINKLMDMHTYTSKAFLAVTTQDAQTLWKNE